MPCSSCFLSLNLTCGHAVTTRCNVPSSRPFSFVLIAIGLLTCPTKALISEFGFRPSQHSQALLMFSPCRSYSALQPGALCPLLCVRCCSVYLSIYLFVCLPVSMSLCVCLAFCLSVSSSGCLPLSVSSPSVAWASVALHEMNALFPPGFRCGVPPG